MVNISIIIPVYNNLDFTIQCVKSIQKQCKTINYEIIIVDDYSTDNTKEFFSNNNKITYVRNEKNKGFAYSCNKGAEKAKGDILIFLNNDTLIVNDICKSVINTFRNFKNIGIVGGKLLYEDNTIQHAGILIYPDKHLGHLFKEFPYNYHNANKIRFLQAVTGAFFCIKKELFLKIGKFDENFKNGFEDVDLCFRVTQNGYRIIYNPDICLYHFEEKTRRENKANDDINSKLISERWFRKIEPDFFLKKEGYDFKLNDIGEFYIIKKDFSEVEEEDLSIAIAKEPLFFKGYKKLISKYLDENNFTMAEEVCKRLIKFEPIIENFQILKSIASLSNNLEKVKLINEVIKRFQDEKFKIKVKMEKMYENFITLKQYEVASYYKEWLINF